MKAKKILIVILMIGCIIGGMIGTVKADTSTTFKANLTANKTSIKTGEEITVTIGVSDINMGENGINTLEGKINYDTNIFEAITSNSIQSLNNWTTTYNDESSTLNGKFLAVNLSSGTKENTQIFSVKFKVKETVTEEKNTKIEFKEITSNDGTNLVNVGDKAVTIKINSENSNGTTNDSNKEDNSENTQNNTTDKSDSNKENTTTQNKATATDNTTAKTIIPKAGKSIAVALLIIALVAVVIVLGIKNKSMTDIK